MEKGFSRLWVRCNTLFCSVLAIVVFGNVITTTAIAQQSPIAAPNIPHPRPENTIISEKSETPSKPSPTYRSACPAWLEGKFQAAPIAPIKEGECGERSPLLLSALGPEKGLTLKPKAQVNCRMAGVLAQWAVEINAYTREQMGAEIESISVGNGYQCRRRNNLPDGKISEHGFANALDITGFKLSDGRTLLVEELAPDESANVSAERNEATNFLEFAQQSACEKFTTVLGPKGDEHHKDHFHFDLGCHGKNCTYKICE